MYENICHETEDSHNGVRCKGPLGATGTANARATDRRERKRRRTADPIRDR